MIDWNFPAEIFKPCGRTVPSKNPNGVENAVFSCTSSLIGILCYEFERS